MKIVLLALTSEDVGESVREMQVKFGDALDLILDNAAVRSGIKTIFVTPLVTRPGIGPFPDKVSYLRSEPSINLSINVPYDQWKTGGSNDHIELIAAAVSEGIGRIKEAKLDSGAKSAILECVECARRQLL